MVGLLEPMTGFSRSFLIDKISKILRANAKQVAGYVGIGGLSALVELLLFQALLSFAHLDAAISNIVALVISTILNFALNGFVNFKMTLNPAIAGLKYLILFAFNMTFSTLTIKFFSDLGAIPIVVKIITMACMTTWNYVLYKRVVFK